MIFSKVLIVAVIIFGFLTNQVEAWFNNRRTAKTTKAYTPISSSPVVVESDN
jgi:hypothetical protein